MDAQKNRLSQIVARAKFLEKKPSVLVALEEISEMYVMTQINVIRNGYRMRYLVDRTFSKVSKFGCVIIKVYLVVLMRRHSHRY